MKRKLEQIRVAGRDVTVEVGAPTRMRVAGRPSYPLLFAKWKGRLRALAIAELPPRRQPETYGIPKCAKISYGCMMGGQRVIYDWTCDVVGRVGSSDGIPAKRISALKRQ